MPSEGQRVAPITVANKGIGFEIAHELGKAGLQALVGARPTPLGEAAETILQAEGIGARFVRIDVHDAETIRSAAETDAGPQERPFKTGAPMATIAFCDR